MKDRVGNTLLHSAVASQNANALYTLLDLGDAELLVSEIWFEKNSNGQTPRDLMYSPVKNQVLMHFQRSIKYGGEVVKYTVSDRRTQLLVFLPLHDICNYVLRASNCFDVDVLELSDPESIEENIKKTQGHGDSAGLIVIIAADSPPDTEAVLRLMCDEVLSRKPKV